MKQPVEATVVSSTTPKWGGHISDPVYQCSITVAVRGGDDKAVMTRLNSIQNYINSGRVDA